MSKEIIAQVYREVLKYYIMSGHNVNIYFQEKTYNKIKPLIAQRKVSAFVNNLVEKELRKEQSKEKEQLKKEMITGYQENVKNKNLQKELEIWDRISGDGLDNE